MPKLVAQNSIRFMPFADQRSGDDKDQWGTLTESSISPFRNYQVILPTGEYTVTWRKSPIKQYDKIFTGRSWIDSKAAIWEGVALNKPGIKLIATTLGESITGLHWIENDKPYHIKKDTIRGHRFSLDVPGQTDRLLQCEYQSKLSLESYSSSRQLTSSCYVIEIGLVTDFGLHQSAQYYQLLESELLGLVAATQTYFNTFDAELNLRIKTLIMPIDESPFPEPGDPAVISFGDLNLHLKYWLLDRGISSDMFDFTIGLTQFNHKTGTLIGHFFGADNSLGLILVEKQGSLDFNVNLLAHELGHGFGAGHDAQTGFIMSALISGGSWSRNSKDQINAFIKREDIIPFFQVCPRLTFTGEAGTNGEVLLRWGTDYEFNVGYYVLRMNEGQVLDTIYAVNSTEQEVTYEFRHMDAPTKWNVYRIYQYSIFDELLKTNNIIVDLTEQTTDEGLAVKPNPFLDKLYLDNLSSGASIVILDAAGRPVFKTIAATSQLQIVTSAFKRGLYLVSVDGKIFRVIKE